MSDRRSEILSAKLRVRPWAERIEMAPELLTELREAQDAAGQHLLEQPEVEGGSWKLAGVRIWPRRGLKGWRVVGESAAAVEAAFTHKVPIERAPDDRETISSADFDDTEARKIEERRAVWERQR